jgi:magnesium transporter
MPKRSSHPYPPDTAGRLALAPVPIALEAETVGAIRDKLRRQNHAVVDLIFVVDRHHFYRGAVPLADLVRHDDSQTVGPLARADWPRVTPETDQEHAVEAAAQSGVAVLPVVTTEGHVVGSLAATSLLDILAREHREDMHRLVGVLSERAGARHALEDPPLKRVLRRIPWLLIGLALSVPVTAVMAGFERALRANVAITFFIPALVYLTDAIGTQTEAIAVRGLSLRRLPLGGLLVKEMATGGLIGLVLGALALTGVWMIFADPVLAISVGVSLFAAGTLASVLGLLLPWLLSRLGIDPAFGSGPVATILQDVLTIVVYFAVVTALLDGGA